MTKTELPLISLAIVVAGALIAAAIFFKTSGQDGRDVSILTGIVCEDSGGAFNGSCACPDGYELENGRCIDAMGVPGGVDGEMVKTKQGNLLQKTKCEISGGDFDGYSCACANGYELEQNYCTDDFGLPGGELRLEIQANHPLAQ